MNTVHICYFVSKHLKNICVDMVVIRPETRWEDDVLGDRRNLYVNNWKKVAQDRDRWKEVVEQARTLHRL
jgi:hypothetical protein